jgi:hypothetical protein
LGEDSISALGEHRSVAASLMSKGGDPEHAIDRVVNIIKPHAADKSHSPSSEYQWLFVLSSDLHSDSLIVPLVMVSESLNRICIFSEILFSSNIPEKIQLNE